MTPNQVFTKEMMLKYIHEQERFTDQNKNVLKHLVQKEIIPTCRYKKLILDIEEKK
jgi:hypothetical protein